MLRQTTEVELNMNSVERILECTDLPLELNTTKPVARCAYLLFSKLCPEHRIARFCCA